MWRKKRKIEKSIEIAQGNGSQTKRVTSNSEDMSGIVHRQDNKSMKLTNYAISQMGKKNKKKST